MTAPRSINIGHDRSNAGVITGYRPTRKTLQVVRAICGTDRSTATHVVAPYGSGKSLAALVGVTLLEQTDELAADLQTRIATVDPVLAERLGKRTTPSRVILLHGACGDLANAIAAAAGIDDDLGPLDKVLAEILRGARKDNIDQIAIVWDEFGQHLETLVREGRAEDLLAVQNLAEWAVRRSEPSVTLTTLMHQGVYHYTRRASETAQAAWKKIEGRFETLSLMDDGLDALEMLAETLNSASPEPDPAAIHRARAAGFFADVTDDSRLADILARTAPLTPAALQILPRLAAQVAQAERTMFRFLTDVVGATALGTRLGVDALYDFFAPALRSDTGPGGTHRRFIEAETALSRTTTPLARRVVKTAALLQLGPSGERVKLSRGRLVYAVGEGTGTPPDAVEAEIDALVSQRLLLHRRRLDDVSVWHGADVDLGQLVAEEAARLSIELDQVAALDRLFPPDAYSAPGYNYARGIIRFARSRFIRAAELTSPAGLNAIEIEAASEDALVLLVIDATADRPEVLEAIRSLPPHILVALPSRTADVGPVLSDLLAIESLLQHRDPLATDPLIERELHELKAEAEAMLRHGLERLMNPDRGEVVWKTGQNSYEFTGKRTPGDILSEIFTERFPLTPRIANEQVVRRKVTGVTRSARKRCMLGVIERSGSPSLGYEGSTSADASLYRTVFEHTGLYAQHGGEWRWSLPDELTDEALKTVWNDIREFFGAPSAHPKKLEDLFAKLVAPPMGLRPGVLPLLITAGMVAFGRSLALRETVDGRSRYVDDIQPSLMEKVCAEPGRFQLEVAELSENEVRNLEKMIQSLAGALDPQEPDLLRGFHDALLLWRDRLPPTALTSRGLGPAADLLQPLLRRTHFDPADFFLRDLPAVIGRATEPTGLVETFVDAVRQIEGVATTFAQRAAEITSEVFRGRLRGAALPLLDAAEHWATSLPLDDVTIPDLDHEARGVLSRSRSALSSQKGEHAFVTQLSGILCGEGFDGWNETTPDTFRQRLEAAVVRIEDVALDRAGESEEFAPFLRNKIATIFDSYGSKIGPDRLIAYLNEIYRENA
jgi:hypothetical protein